MEPKGLIFHRSIVMALLGVGVCLAYPARAPAAQESGDVLRSVRAPCNRGKGEAIANARSCGEALPAIKKEFEESVRYRVEAFYRGCRLDIPGEMPALETLEDTCPGRKVEGTICNVIDVPNVPKHFNLYAENNVDHLGNRCGTWAVTNVRASTDADGNGVCSASPSDTGKKSAIDSYLRGAWVQAHNCYYQRVALELDRGRIQLTELRDAQGGGTGVFPCRLAATKYLAQRRRLEGASGAETKEILQTTEDAFADLSACEAGLRAERSYRRFLNLSDGGKKIEAKAGEQIAAFELASENCRSGYVANNHYGPEFIRALSDFSMLTWSEWSCGALPKSVAAADPALMGTCTVEDMVLTGALAARCCKKGKARNPLPKSCVPPEIYEGELMPPTFAQGKRAPLAGFLPTVDPAVINTKAVAAAQSTKSPKLVDQGKIWTANQEVKDAEDLPRTGVKPAPITEAKPGRPTTAPTQLSAPNSAAVQDVSKPGSLMPDSPGNRDLPMLNLSAPAPKGPKGAQAQARTAPGRSSGNASTSTGSSPVARRAAPVSTEVNAEAINTGSSGSGAVVTSAGTVSSGMPATGSPQVVTAATQPQVATSTGAYWTGRPAVDPDTQLAPHERAAEIRKVQMRLRELRKNPPQWSDGGLLGRLEQSLEARIQKLQTSGPTK